jgi:hypothetical protein
MNTAYLLDELLGAVDCQVDLLLGLDELEVTRLRCGRCLLDGTAGALVMHESSMLLGLRLVEGVELGARVALVGQEAEMHDEHVLEDLLLVEREVARATARRRGRAMQRADGRVGRLLAIRVAGDALERVTLVHQLHVVAHWRVDREGFVVAARLHIVHVHVNADCLVHGGHCRLVGKRRRQQGWWLHVGHLFCFFGNESLAYSVDHNWVVDWKCISLVTEAQAN